MYYSDNPILSSEEDLLGRSGFARILAESLVNLKAVDTFTVGLFGKWGSGKTSIVNMALREINTLQANTEAEDKLVVVHFEPWNFSTTDQLLSQFFIRLSNEFKSKKDKQLKAIADAIDNYSDSLDALEVIPGVGKAVAILGKYGAGVASKKLKKGDDRKDIQKQKEFIIQLIKQQKQRILVVIDDIDRLSSEQIRQVFQLIASVAKFPNTMYLLVFDKDIVVSALEKVQEGKGEDYLEKIIQMPIQIPDISKSKIRELTIDKLNTVIACYKDISFQQERWQQVFGYCIEPFINSLRDVNRLCNSVQFKLTSISSEVDFVDMVAISVLEIAVPDVYEWIKGNKSILTGSVDVATIRLHGKPQKELYSQFSSEIELLLHNDTISSENVINALSCIFPYFGQLVGKVFEAHDAKQLRRNSRLAHSDKFDRYFNLDLNAAEIKKAEVLNAVSSLDSKGFRDFLLDFDARGISYDFLEEVNSLIPEIQPERAATIIKALFGAAEELDNASGGVLSLRASNYAEHMIIDLLEVVEPESRLKLLEDEVKCSDIVSLPSIAVVINIIELAYGRLAANGEERKYGKVIALEELLALEVTFKDRVEELLKSNSLFDFKNWEIIGVLLENYDPDYMQDYYTRSFTDAGNIIRYLDCSVSEWIGSGIEYEVRDEYGKHLTDDQINNAIETVRTTGELFKLPMNIQYKAAAFFLYKTNRVDYHDYIDQADTDRLLSEWKNSFSVSS